jgi:hypothetical protein
LCSIINENCEEFSIRWPLEDISVHSYRLTNPNTSTTVLVLSFLCHILTSQLYVVYKEAEATLSRIRFSGSVVIHRESQSGSWHSPITETIGSHANHKAECIRANPLKETRNTVLF